jgi:hypothetical protein
MAKFSTGLRTAMLYNAGIMSMFNRGRIYLYANEPPLTADEPPGASPIGVVCEGGTIPVPGEFAGGLQFEIVGPAYLRHLGNWVLKGLGTGVPLWWRMQWNPPDNGAFSLYYPRMDGLVGESLFNLPESIVPATTTPNCEFHMHFVQPAED